MTRQEKQIDVETRERASSDQKSGFVLVSLLIVASVGILFGFGRLLLYRYQCQLRIQRQHELEKVFAVRSAVKWVEVQSGTILDTVRIKSFNFEAVPGRTLGVDVCQVTPIYPSDSTQFNITNALCFSGSWPGVSLSGEGGMHPVVSNTVDGIRALIGPGTNTAGKIGRIAVDMSGSGSWLDDTFGRRYMVDIKEINRSIGTETGDTVKLYIVPAEFANDIDNAPAIGLTCRPLGPSSDYTTTSAWIRRQGEFTENMGSTTEFKYNNGKGFQISGQYISLYNWVQVGRSDICGTFSFSEQYNIPDDMISAFMQVDGETTKELMMVLEVKQTGAVLDANAHRNSFNRFQVLPAYEFDIALTWPDRNRGTHREIATVVHVKPKSSVRNNDGKAYTYDTHGVERRGYE